MSVGLSSFLTSMSDASFRNPDPMPPRKNKGPGVPASTTKGGAKAKPARKSASGNAGTKAKGKIAKGQSDKVKKAAEKKEAEKKKSVKAKKVKKANERKAALAAAAAAEAEKTESDEDEDDSSGEEQEDEEPGQGLTQEDADAESPSGPGQAASLRQGSHKLILCSADLQTYLAHISVPADHVLRCPIDPSRFWDRAGWQVGWQVAEGVYVCTGWFAFARFLGATGLEPG